MSSAPSTPTSITIANPFLLNASNIINWTHSTGGSGWLYYLLERSTDNGKTWVEIHNGNKNSTTDYVALPTGSSSVSLKYRLKAYDDAGNYSDYFYSSTVTGYNSAPSAPIQITVNSVINGGGTINGGDNVAVLWQLGLDNENNLEGYILEVSTNEGSSWNQIYKGASQEYSYLVVQGTPSVMFRVKSYDDCGLESPDYKTSNIISVVNNTPPVITGLTDGSHLGAFSYVTSDITYGFSYYLGDQPLSVTITEIVNKEMTYTLNSYGTGQNIFFIPYETWNNLANGLHSLTVIVASSCGTYSTTCTVTFTKVDSEIELMHKTAISSDSMPTKGIYTVEKVTTSNAIFSFHVCNNGFDSVPTWEDVTEKVLAGERFSFTNKSKTASKWGVNILVKVDRNNTVGDCYISRVQGYFK